MCVCVCVLACIQKKYSDLANGEVKTKFMRINMKIFIDLFPKCTSILTFILPNISLKLLKPSFLSNLYFVEDSDTHLSLFVVVTIVTTGPWICLIGGMFPIK